MATSLEFGDIARDRLTNFQGVVIARVESYHNCDRYLLQPQGLEHGTNKLPEQVEFDITTLEWVGHLEGYLAHKARTQSIRLGDLVCDLVSRFEGKAVRRHISANGCVLYDVQPMSISGTSLPRAARFFDNDLVVVRRVETDESKPEVRPETGGIPTPGGLLR